jgi:hypothetical protein
MRSIRLLVLEISDMLCSRRGVYSSSNNHQYLSSGAHLQHIMMSFQRPEETREIHTCVLEILHIVCFGGQVL